MPTIEAITQPSDKIPQTGSMPPMPPRERRFELFGFRTTGAGNGFSAGPDS
ncbi:MAG TPA: hypothetical protein VGJ26_21885 [Pirellulales bacterium]